ncbi:MAG: hypothetical protein KDC07_02005 [Chitinophagaceae bacterium]|nr:hypothetical protein [Chitinophagaceae bacterium]MCB9046809.1 hypothetical protein [Chitinophagales bacterium]
MIKSSIGELKISPIKEDGMFVFFNDFITINGKVSKGDSVKVFVQQYDNKTGTFVLDKQDAAKASIIVRGKEKLHENITGYDTLDKLYEHVSALYREHFYFGDKE